MLAGDPGDGISNFARRLGTSHAMLSRLGAALVSAVILTAAFPIFNFWPIAWVALVPLYIALSANTRAQSAFLIAWTFGVPLFLLGAYWMLFLIDDPLVRVIPWAMLAMIEAIPFGIQAVVTLTIGPRLPNGSILRPILFATVWVTGEWMRGWGKVAFPWFLLAASQTHAPLPLLQILSLTGQWGLSFAVALCSALLGEAWLARRQPRTARRLVLTAIALPLGLSSLGLVLIPLRSVSATGRHTISIAGIQGDIDKQALASPTYRETTMQSYTELTLLAGSAIDKPDLIVWPETVVPGLLLHEPDLMREVAALAVRTNTSLLVGTVDEEAVTDASRSTTHVRHTNTAILLDSEGVVRGRYDKLQIVPIGEYFPLRWLLASIYARFGVPDYDLDPGVFNGVLRIPIADGGEGMVGEMICYDDVFPTQPRDRVRNGAGVLTLMTSDDTFGATAAGPQQHADLDVLRAVETARYLVRAAATGPSEVVTPIGTVESVRPAGQRGVAQMRMPLLQGQTLFVRWGDWFAWGCLIIASVLGIVAIKARPAPAAHG